ncbi:MAG: UDP-N-acetylglucosamine 2-epimerase (hydrolyzing) [Candidatus Omnitrophica bacterium]|nr:UDP-N-acetylglucosamine 2-epimerase (hydrolyzing) [Candidatus Omnitrophota bacterium]
MGKKILFLTSTRADFGKLKPLMNALEKESGFEVFVFVTGMHMFPKYGNTGDEVAKCGFKNIFYFINQKPGDSMDTILANTVEGLGNYMSLNKPDIIIVHGDRAEALAGAISGALNNFLVAHIEGGEVSGTIDESIRHSVSKLAHIHFVANTEARNRLIRMGEDKKNIYVTGSPDIDLMLSNKLPSLEEVKRYYEISFDKYALFVYHPVTTNLHNLLQHVKAIMAGVCKSGKNFVVIYPNNDPGADIIIEELELARRDQHFRIFPCLRFEYFLTLLRNCEFIIGNSSAGIREAPIYSIPSINIGSRQKNRYSYKTIINVNESAQEILDAIKRAGKIKGIPSNHFGDGNSVVKFVKVMKSGQIWKTRVQKYFVDNYV